MHKRLSEKEEALMQIVWDRGPVFAKEVREALPEPRPHINTIATMMRRLAGKGVLSIEDFGSTYRYTATVTQKEYTKRFVKPLLSSLFGNSIKNAVRFLAEEEDITAEELKDIIKLIEKKKK